MNRKLLATAIAGALTLPAALTTAAADSSVTLFGQLQAQLVHYSSDLIDEDGIRFGDGGHFNGNGTQFSNYSENRSDPSRLGVMVRHDLGNGLTGLAKLEQNANTRDGFSTSAREANIGLQGDFGRVLAGRVATPYTTAGKDPLNATFMQARGNGGRLGPINGFGNGNYVNRGLRYTGGFGPVNLDLATFIDATDDSNSALSGKLAFDAGPVELYLAHTSADDFGNDELADFGDFRTSKVGVDWSDGPFRVVAEVEDFQWDNLDGTGAIVSEDKGNTYFVSGTWTMGRNAFHLNLGHTRNRGGHSDGENNDVTYVALAMRHTLGSNVSVHGGVVYNDFDNEIFSPDQQATWELDPTGSTSFTGIGGGMRVSF